MLAAAAAAPTALAADTVVNRSAYSTTVKSGDAYTTRTYPEQVNFQNERGGWSTIDRSLEPGPNGTVRPAAVDGDAAIPETLGKPVVLKHDGRTVSFRLLGADGAAGRKVAGSRASFARAVSGVDVSYKVRANGLKELIELSGRAARRAFSYDVRADADLTAAIAGGDLVFTDDAGTERFRVAAPLAWDSAKNADRANALTLSVVRTGDRQWRMTMRVDDRWLDDPARVFPVTLDPDYYWVDGALRFHGANQDCAMAGNDFASRNLCAYGALQVGYGNGRPYKSVMKFDIAAAIPAYAKATSARFLAYQFPSSQKYERSSRLRTVTSQWDNTATWSKRSGTTSWTTPGGDVSSDPALTGAPTTIGPSGYWSYWDAPLTAINGWIAGTLPNYGFQLSTDQTYPDVRSAYEFTSTDGAQGEWPALEVTWMPDTVAPNPVAGFRVAAYDASNVATIAWDTPTDPKLANGTDGSGVASTTLAVSVNGVARPTVPVTEAFYDVPNVAAGSQITAVLTVTDRAGNVRTASLSAPNVQPLLDDPATDSAAADSYQAEFGGTRAAAETWIANQNKVLASQDATAPDGSILEAARSAATPAGYGGAYFDNATRQFVVRTTPQANMTSVNSLLASLNVPTRVDSTTITADRLRTVQSNLEDQLVDLLRAGKLEIRAFESTGRLELTISTLATAAEESRIRAASTDNIPTTYTKTSESLLAETTACSTDDCDGWVRGGVYITVGSTSPLHCTLGLIGKRANGQRVGVTAAHCNGSGDTKIAQPVYYGENERRFIGNTDKITYGVQGDYVLIPFATNLLATSSVVVTAGPQTTRRDKYPIRSSAPNIEGHQTCFTGSTTDVTKCGRIISRTGEVTYKNGPTITGLAESTVCPIPGDSGAPFFKTGKALGIASGWKYKTENGVKKCVKGYYTGARTIESIESLDGFKFKP